MKRVLVVPLLSAFCSIGAIAQQVPESPGENTSGIVALDTTVVTGSQPGPGLWKVSKTGHVLWVLGTLSPLPKDLQWRTDEIETRIAESKAVLSGIKFKLTPKLGFFQRLFLLPSLIAVRDNPGHAKLASVVPPALYARWLEVKQRYIGRSRSVEDWRPIFAALELFRAAIRKAGLEESDIASRLVRGTARRAGIPVQPATLSIHIDDPKSVVKEFKRTSLDDQACFEQTVDKIDSDLKVMVLRANAWSTGDLDALRRLPFDDQMQVCMEAITEAGLAREQGIADIPERIERAWVDAAASMLARNDVSFAVLPIRFLLDENGYLARLQARGYAVEAPDADPAEPE